VGDLPNRSTKETITQLVVIAFLIAIVIVAVIFLRSYVDSHKAIGANPATSTSNVHRSGFYDVTLARQPSDAIFVVRR
jgi:hypothetical protein